MKKSLHAVGFSSVFFHLGSFSKGDIFLLFLYIFWISFLLGFRDGGLENFCFVLESHLCF